MNLADLIPPVRDTLIFIIGAAVGALLIVLGALMSAAGRMDDLDEQRGVRRS